MKQFEKQSGPTPQQMFRLASLCIDLGRSASKRPTFVTHQTRTDSWLPDYYMIFSSDFYQLPDPGYLDLRLRNPISVSKKFIGRVAMRDQAWTLFMHEVSEVYKSGHLHDKSKAMYRFNWTGGQVLRARRYSHFTDLEEDYGESLQPVEFDDLLCEADYLNGVNEIQSVGAEDCDRLIGEIGAISEAINIPRWEESLGITLSIK